MLWSKRDRPFFETLYMKWIIENKYKKDVIQQMEKIIWIPVVWKTKRRFKSIQHYLINEQEKSDKQAWHSLQQFMDECEIVAEKLNILKHHEFNL